MRTLNAIAICVNAIAGAKRPAHTPLRDINELIAAGILRRTEGCGRSTAYELVDASGVTPA